MTRHQAYAFALCALLCCLFLMPSTGSSAEGAGAGRAVIERGDLVKVRATAALEDGTIVFTSDPTLAGDKSVRTITGYVLAQKIEPVALIAGEKAEVPGLGEILVGMHEGETKSAAVPPEKAYGTRDPSLVRSLDRIRQTGRTMSMGPGDFVARFGKFPVVGNDVSLIPYFKTRIVQVTENGATLRHDAQPGAYTDSIGKTEVGIEGETITLNLVPMIGAPFELDGRKGRISSFDDKSFTVDLNHPAAGHAVTLSIAVEKVTKAMFLNAAHIPWIDDHNKGLSEARKRNCPSVVVLYSSTCSWCERLMNETCENPLVKSMRDEFVWIKVDSEVNRQFYDLYDQEGYPTTVILDAKGDLVRKISGFQDAESLGRSLSECLGKAS